jgi:hypothetical protein
MGYGLMGFKAMRFRQGSNYSFMHNERWDHGTLVARCYKSRADWPHTHLFPLRPSGAALPRPTWNARWTDNGTGQAIGRMRT